MTRREILKYTAFITGAAVSAPFMGAFLSGCKPENSGVSASALSCFSEKEMSLLKDIVDTILPKTDSPSASEVGIHLTIDSMVGKVYTEENKNKFKERFSALQKVLNNKSFRKADVETRSKMLVDMEVNEDPSMADAKRVMLELKQQTIAYYLSTSEIATNYLNYLPVPGNYESCIALADVGGKAWAL